MSEAERAQLLPPERAPTDNGAIGVRGDVDGGGGGGGGPGLAAPGAGRGAGAHRHGGGGRFAFRDEDRDMTASRRLARALSGYSWYYPRAAPASASASVPAAGGGGGDGDGDGAEEGEVDDDNGDIPPSIDAAWAYFEHVTLPRYRPGASSGRDRFPAARSGDDRRETRLYPVWGTPEEDLGDFGEGVGLYFFTLRSLSVILLVAGLINIPNIMYYASDLYNNDVAGGVDPVLSGTAICTDERWVACPTCTPDQWDYFPHTYDRYASTPDGSRRFIVSNACRITYWDGFRLFLSLLFVFAAISALCFRVLRRREVELDVAQQTTTDYSLQVGNPPRDARDADEWADFFSMFGHVTCCTVALDNEELVRALVRRRRLVADLSTLMPPGVKLRSDGSNLDEAAGMASPPSLFRRLMCAGDAKSLRDEIARLGSDVRRMSEKSYGVSEVFVTFETEAAQRRALTELSVPRWKVACNVLSALPEELRFRGDRLLKVREPPEPSAVRWDDLDKSLLVLILQRALTSTLTLAFIVGGCFLIRRVRNHHGAAIAALFISALNSAAPYMCAYVTDLESHHSEGSKQASRYFKITASLWAFTALITSIVTPFTETVSNDKGSVIRSLYAIFIFEMLRSPVTKALDIQGHVYRHFLGPRAVNQERMNMLFQGARYELSERYTNMTNVLFVTLYYGTIFPSGFFFAAATLFIHYWTDKFCLLRNWARAPILGTQISVRSRLFIMITIVVFAVISSYYIASFPFDNVCEDTSTVASDYVGNWTAVIANGRTTRVEVQEGDRNYFFCNQDMLRYAPPAFPAVPSNQPQGGEWMDQDQERISLLFGWTSIIVIAGVAAILLGKALSFIFRRCCVGPYEPEGEPGREAFSDPDLEIFGYVPQVRVPGLPFPLLLCDVSGIDDELVGWHDPYRGYRAHNVLYDVPGLGDREGLFSEVRHWPPPSAAKREKCPDNH